MLISRYGRIHIRVDEPVSIVEVAAQRGFNREKYTEEQKRGLVRALGYRIVEGINRATALTPGALLCTALLAHDWRGLTAADLVDRMEFLLDVAVQSGAPLTFHREPERWIRSGKAPSVRRGC